MMALAGLLVALPLVVEAQYNTSRCFKSRDGNTICLPTHEPTYPRPRLDLPRNPKPKYPVPTQRRLECKYEGKC